MDSTMASGSTGISPHPVLRYLYHPSLCPTMMLAMCLHNQKYSRCMPSAFSLEMLARVANAMLLMWGFSHTQSLFVARALASVLPYLWCRPTWPPGVLRIGICESLAGCTCSGWHSVILAAQVHIWDLKAGAFNLIEDDIHQILRS